MYLLFKAPNKLISINILRSLLCCDFGARCGLRSLIELCCPRRARLKRIGQIQRELADDTCDAICVIGGEWDTTTAGLVYNRLLHWNVQRNSVI